MKYHQVSKIRQHVAQGYNFFWRFCVLHLLFTLLEELCMICVLFSCHFTLGYVSFELLTSSLSRPCQQQSIPDSKVRGANMAPIWGRQDPGGPHVGPMNFALWDVFQNIFVDISLWPFGISIFFVIDPRSAAHYRNVPDCLRFGNRMIVLSHFYLKLDTRIWIININGNDKYQQWQIIYWQTIHLQNRL